MRAINLIRRAAPMLGGTYYTHDYMHGKNGWLDLYFLGVRFPIFYNVALQTARHAYKEKVLNEALRRVDLIVPEHEKWRDITHKEPGTGQYVTRQREPQRYAELDGLSRYEWVFAQQQVIADEKCVKIYERWEVRKDYISGVGIHATLDVPYLTAEAVERFIERFLADPQSYHNPVPLSYASSDIDDWGMEANSLVEPWEWHMLDEASNAEISQSSPT